MIVARRDPHRRYRRAVAATASDDTSLAAFLRARRERLIPAQVGLGDGQRRRVPGLRREEVAMLAQLSITYYVRLEQGRDRHPSPEVVGALADALRLDAASSRHLHTLAGLPGPSSDPPAVRGQLHALLERHLDTPAFVIGPTSEVLAANRLATGLHPSYRVGRNLLADLFLDASARAAYVAQDLPGLMRDGVAGLRVAVAHGAAGGDALLERLRSSAEFTTLWQAHDVIEKRAARQRFRHPRRGVLELEGELFEVSGAAGQRLVVLHAPDTGSAGGPLIGSGD